MIKIAICDDEQAERKNLYNMIRGFTKIDLDEIDIKQFASGKQLLNKNYHPDILFLDVIMDELDGIETGKQIKEIYPSVIIIYITCLKETISIAVNKVHAFGYLEKPISEENVLTLLKEALAHFRREAKEDTVTFLSENNSIIKLSPSDIYYFEYSQRKVKIVTKGESYICKDKISEIAEKMKLYDFAMCHQSFVVNLFEVDRIVPPDLIMKNNDKVHLAQKRQSAIRRMIKQIAQNQWREEK